LAAVVRGVHVRSHKEVHARVRLDAAAEPQIPPQQIFLLHCAQHIGHIIKRGDKVGADGCFVRAVTGAALA